MPTCFATLTPNHADQWQWALDNLPIVTPWILALDADFVVTLKLLAAQLTRNVRKIIAHFTSSIDNVTQEQAYFTYPWQAFHLPTWTFCSASGAGFCQSFL